MSLDRSAGGLAGRIAWAEALLRSAGAGLADGRAWADVAGTGPAVACKDGDHRDLVTACDLAVERLVRDALAEAWPGERLVSEESHRRPPEPDEPAWYLDPIDGTANFVHAGRDFALSLALWVGREPLFGLVYDPQADAMYRGVRGGGAWVDGRRVEPGAVRRRRPAGEGLGGLVLDASLNTLVWLAGRGVDLDDLSRALLAHRSGGCASLALVRIALGQIDAFVSPRLRSWDWAAAAVFLAELGGECRSLDGEGLDPAELGGRPVLAARDAAAGAALRRGLRCAPAAASSSKTQE